MKIEKIAVKNYRLLRNTLITCENDLSIIVGKNNCGKTSLMSVLKKCIGDNSEIGTFEYYDLSLCLQRKLYEIVNKEMDFERNKLYGIRVDIYISYTDNDDISNLSQLLLDLDPNNKTVVLRFEYSTTEEAIEKLKNVYKNYLNKHTSISTSSNNSNSSTKRNNLKNPEINKFSRFMQKHHKDYFVFRKYSVLFDYVKQELDENTFKVLDKKNFDISKIISFNYIDAKRDVSNASDNDLSILSNKYYSENKSKDEEDGAVSKFENQIDETDADFSEIYAEVFKDLLNKISIFGGMKKDDSKIKIISQMHSAKLLKDNTTVVYDDNESNYLPEHYNGLGYLNLISIIIKIETVLSKIKKENKKDELPSDINLIFIEEPEAHTHPQMQYIFIKNIKKQLEKGRAAGKSKIQLQTFMTTHSSHIVSECDFDDLKYFVKEKDAKGYNIVSKNLKDLEIKYQNEAGTANNHFKFLKQYLTLNRSEIFFADKIILIEGDTERILLPAMMKKLDQENEFDTPLLSQNISIIEVGNYSEIYSEFISFLNTKTLIITDIDSYNIVQKNAGSVENSQSTTNSALKFYLNDRLKEHSNTEIDILTGLTLSDKTIKHSEIAPTITKTQNNHWVSNPDGNVLIVYQISETNSAGVTYNARSFEDSFFHINKDLFTDLPGATNEEKIKNCKLSFQGLKNVKYFFDSNKDSYDLATNCVNKKPSLAMDILLNSKSIDGKDFANWQIPLYIKEGLLWLQKD